MGVCERGKEGGGVGFSHLQSREKVQPKRRANMVTLYAHAPADDRTHKSALFECSGVEARAE